MNVLFIDSVHPILESRLTQSGYQCTDATQWNKEQIFNVIEQYQGVVIRSKFTIDQTFLVAAKQLKFIARSGSGLENIDQVAAKAHHVQVFNSPEGNRNAVAEHALGMLLMLFNKLKHGDAEVRNQEWNREKNRGIELDGLTLGLIGYGNTGRRFAKKLSGFDVIVLAYDKYAPITDENAQAASLKEIQEQSDVISFHLPETDETRYLFSETFIANCTHPFYLINTARGKIVHTESLMKGMKSGKVLGACLDVLEYETKAFGNFEGAQIPEPFTYLANSDKVVLTPHVAGWTHESYVKLATTLFDKIMASFGERN